MRAFLILIWLATPAVAAGPKVVTDIAPVHSLVAQVMDGVGIPDLLLQPGDDPHHMALRPSQASAIAAADLVIWVGPALAPWLGEVLASQGARTLPLAPDLVEDEDDPHLWLDPALALHWLPEIAEALSVADPQNAALYQRNAKETGARLADLTLRVLGTLKDDRGARLITAHDAWGHFADAFGLQIVGAIRTHEDSAPGARHLAELGALVREGAVDCIVSEGVESDALVETLAAGSGVPLTNLHPVGQGITPGPAFYEALLEGVAQGIAACADGG